MAAGRDTPHAGAQLPVSIARGGAVDPTNRRQKKPRRSGALKLEAEVGIEPAYADLQSAA
jgi:hypothetical protein